MTENYKYYLETEDFEGALDRFYNTTKNWKKHWYDVCYQIAKSCKTWLCKYVFDPIAITIEKRDPNYWTNKIDTNGVDLLDKGLEKCYLFRFYDVDNNLMFSKVGTTTMTVIKRLKQELKEYQKKGVDHAIIDRVYDCGKIPADGLESYIRAEYIKQYPDAFMKNDRFNKIEFDFKLVDQLMKEYLGA